MQQLLCSLQVWSQELQGVELYPEYLDPSDNELFRKWDVTDYQRHSELN